MAHIPDGFLSPPVLTGTAAASAAALAVAARRSRSALRERQAPLLGALTAFVFAAQMFNFPLGAGTSAHLLGGVLVAVIAGPWVGMLAIFSILLVQALLFQDGGIAALGANTLNMAVLGAGGGYLVYRGVLLFLGVGARRRLAAAGAAAYVSAALIGLAAALELSLSDVLPLRSALLVVLGGHLIVGFGEAGLTVAILSLATRARPELLAERPVAASAARRWAWVGVAVALVVAVLAGYVASRDPDALQAAAVRLGVRRASVGVHAPLADYAAPLGGAWVAAVIGVAVVFLVGWLLFRATARDHRSA